MHASAQYWIRHLNLEPHPEGGFYRQTYRAASLVNTPQGARAASTAIYFLLDGNDFSALHRIHSDEVWHFYAGSTLLVHSIDSQGDHAVTRLGSNSEHGETFQHIVPAGHWFGSHLEELDSYALVGCTVAPGFDFADFELADAVELTAQFPQRSDLIRRLSRVA